jgi:hypothetical protein
MAPTVNNMAEHQHVIGNQLDWGAVYSVGYLVEKHRYMTLSGCLELWEFLAAYASLLSGVVYRQLAHSSSVGTLSQPSDRMNGVAGMQLHRRSHLQAKMLPERCAHPQEYINDVP